MLGHFEGREAERIVKRLQEQHISFEVNDCRQIGLYTVWPFYRSCLCIYVRREDKEKAEAISDEYSVRSRATAGIRYVVIGGIICSVALIKMRSGVRTIPWTEKFGGYVELPLEMVAGIAGIVVFMGFLQIVIATSLKLRRRG